LKIFTGKIMNHDTQQNIQCGQETHPEMLSMHKKQLMLEALLPPFIETSKMKGGR
jgi:hypothetical protein